VCELVIELQLFVVKNLKFSVNQITSLNRTVVRYTGDNIYNQYIIVLVTKSRYLCCYHIIHNTVICSFVTSSKNEFLIPLSDPDFINVIIIITLESTGFFTSTT
jgi:hypothetical protein